MFSGMYLKGTQNMVSENEKDQIKNSIENIEQQSEEVNRLYLETRLSVKS